MARSSEQIFFFLFAFRNNDSRFNLHLPEHLRRSEHLEDAALSVMSFSVSERQEEEVDVKRASSQDTRLSVRRTQHVAV